MYHWSAMNGLPICGQNVKSEDTLADMVSFYKNRNNNRCPICGEFFHSAVMSSFDALEDTNKQAIIDGYIIGRLQADGGENCPDMADFTYDSPIANISALRFFVAVCWHYMALYGINSIEITDYSNIGEYLALALDCGREILIDAPLPAVQKEIVYACAWAFSACRIALYVENGELLAE